MAGQEIDLADFVCSGLICTFPHYLFYTCINMFYGHYDLTAV